MAIVKMNKFTLLAFESQRVELLKKLQTFSEVEFINLQNEELIENNEVFQGLRKGKSDSVYAGCEDELSMAKFTLQYLKEFVPQKSGIKAMKEGKKELTISELEEAVQNSDWKKICAKVKEKEDKISSLEHEKSKLQNQIDSLKPWENFDSSFGELDDMKTPYFLGSLPKQYEESLDPELTNCYYEIISKNNQDIFLFILCDKDNKDEVADKLRGFGFSQFKTELEETPIKIIHDNMDSIEKIDSNIYFVKEELANLDENLKTLELVVEYYENKIIRKGAVNNFLETENITVIQGWIPKSENDSLNKLVESTLGNDYSLTFEEVKEEEISQVPVKLKNNAINEAFEDITVMYSTPRYDEIDPTPVVAPFYLLFFGMMIADVGYGLVLLIATAIALKVLNFEASMKKFIKFFLYLSIPTIGFGLAYGTFFGDLIVLPTQILDSNKDINAILYLSIAFGVVQIFFGLGVKAYMLIRDGKPLDAFYDVGSWVITLLSIAAIFGGTMFGFPSILTKIGIAGAIFGAIVIVVFTERKSESIGARLGGGAYALYGITNYVGDLVSYTRLMALGLAGGSLGSAMNLLMDMVPGVAGIIFTPVIFIFGHLFNLALSLLSAYVHTCRLQYVEYFGKFYEGGGKSFSPFKSSNKFINIKKENIN